MGESFSGNERNCGYLNLGQGKQRFANVSAISGIDFPDDARGLALLDWDHDGDLDAWLTNRTAPRLRLLRNEATSDNHFVNVRLEGRDCNRNAIGARVEVFAAEQPNTDSPSANLKQVKTARAGEGFATQSSRWLHFGLGDTVAIEKIIVHWPGGSAETFARPKANAWFDLVQGTGVAKEWTPPKRSFTLTPSVVNPEEPTGGVRSVLTSPPPLPQLTYTNLDGNPAVLGKPRQRAQLVTLWQSDCPACKKELKEFSAQQERLKSAGLDLALICVDQVTGDDDEEGGVDAAGAKAILDRLNLSVDSGMASPTFLDQFFLVLEHLYIRDIEPSVPTSLLLEPSGKIAVVYRGRVGLDQVLADMPILSTTGQERRNASVPLSGRWLLPKYREDSHMSRLAFMLAGEGFNDASVAYLERNVSAAKDDPRYEIMLIAAANALLSKDEFAAAEAKFREAIRIAPDSFDARTGLANVLLSQRRHQQAIPILRAVIEQRPKDVEVLASLGVALQFVNQPDEAVALYRRALAIDPAHDRANLFLAKFLRYNNRAGDAIPHFRAALTADPASEEVNFELGMALLDQGETEGARKHLRTAGEAAGEFIGRMNAQARRLAAHASASPKQRQEAIVLGEMVVELTQQKHPVMLDTLAVAYAASGQFAEAIETEEKAIALLAGNEQAKAMTTEMEKRLDLFRNSKPFVAPTRNN